MAPSSTSSQFSHSGTKPGPADQSTAWLGLHARMRDWVEIYIAPSCRKFANRIELSSGTRLADTQETAISSMVPFTRKAQGCHVNPGGRPPPKRFESLIVTEVPRNMAASIAIVRLPGEFSDDWREAIRNADTSQLRPRCCNHFGRSASSVNPCTALDQSQIPQISRLLPSIVKSVAIMACMSTTGTSMTFSSRQHATNRICINIGKEDRYFMFLPLSLIAIASVLAGEMGPDWEAHATICDRSPIHGTISGHANDQMPARPRRGIHRSD